MDPGGESREGKKELGIGGDLEIEVDKAVDSDGEAAAESAKDDGATATVMSPGSAKSGEKEDENKGKSKETPDDTCIGKDLKVVIMRLFDALGAGALVVGRVGIRKGAETDTKPGMVGNESGGRQPDVATTEPFILRKAIFNLAGGLGEIANKTFRSDQKE